MTAPTPAPVMLMMLTVEQWEQRQREIIREELAVAPKPDKPNAYVSTPHMAERLSISRAKLHQLSSDDGAPCIWVGDVRRWPPVETVAWFKARGRVGK